MPVQKRNCSLSYTLHNKITKSCFAIDFRRLRSLLCLRIFAVAINHTFALQLYNIFTAFTNKMSKQLFFLQRNNLLAFPLSFTKQACCFCFIETFLWFLEIKNKLNIFCKKSLGTFGFNWKISISFHDLVENTDESLTKPFST